MKVLAVLGSPSRDGNSSVLAREVLKGAQAIGAETEEIFLADYQIEFCRGCMGKGFQGICTASGQCIISDDAMALREKLYAADGIVLASPSYGIMETARMKNFLVDRIGMYTAYTSSLGGKYFVGVSTCGGIGAGTVAKSLATHFTVGFHQRGYTTGYLGVKLGMDRVETKTQAMKKAQELGQRLALDIQSQRKYPFQKLPDRILTSMVIRRVILKNIYQNKDGVMKAVYENLLGRGLIQD